MCGKIHTPLWMVPVWVVTSVSKIWLQSKSTVSKNQFHHFWGKHCKKGREVFVTDRQTYHTPLHHTMHHQCIDPCTAQLACQPKTQSRPSWTCTQRHYMILLLYLQVNLNWLQTCAKIDFLAKCKNCVNQFWTKKILSFLILFHDLLKLETSGCFGAQNICAFFIKTVCTKPIRIT